MSSTHCDECDEAMSPTLRVEGGTSDTLALRRTLHALGGEGMSMPRFWETVCAAPAGSTVAMLRLLDGRPARQIEDRRA